MELGARGVSPRLKEKIQVASLPHSPGGPPLLARRTPLTRKADPPYLKGGTPLLERRRILLSSTGGYFCPRPACGPPEPGCDRADESRGIAGPEPESRAQRRVWALAQIGGGAVSGSRASGAHTEGSAGVRRLRERARIGLKSAATQLQACVSAASERSVSTIYRRPVPVVPAKQQRVTASSKRRPREQSRASSSSPSCSPEAGIAAKQSKPVVCSAECTARCSGQRGVD